MRALLRGGLLAASLVIAAQSNATSIITDWNPVVIDCVLADAPTPTTSTHVLSCVFTAAYEAWSAYDAVACGPLIGNSLDGLGGAATRANKEEAISHAIYTTLEWFAPTKLADARAFMEQRGFTPGANTAPARLGRNVADRIATYRMTDSSNQMKKYRDISQYDPQPATDPAAWQPVVINGVAQKPLTPHWGNVIPFAMRSASQFRPAPPAPVDSQRWQDQIQQVIGMSANLTNEQKAIAEYWRPEVGTPPILLARNTELVSQMKAYGLDEDVKLFYAIHNAMLDAGISCWDAKYHYDYIRPITAIRNLGERLISAWGGPGLGTQTIPASSFQPYQPASNPTPPFPEYTSGHSTFSAAWAEIMKSFTGSDEYGGTVTLGALDFEGVTLDRPITLTWPTFTAAAEEAGMSRLYGGIHFMDANLAGQEAGRKVAQAVWEKVTACFEGTIRPSSVPCENLTAEYWNQETLEVFDAPLFTTIGGIGLAVDTPGNTFGYWQTGELDALPAGEYKMSVDLFALSGPKGTRLPELRLRVFTADNSQSAMAVAAQTDINQPYIPIEDLEAFVTKMEMPGEGKPGSSINVYWKSDGSKPFRIALDLLAFAPDIAGGVVASKMSYRRTSP